MLFYCIAALLLSSVFDFGNAACPTIISKSGWGGRAPSGTPSTMTTPVPYTVIHHGGTQTFCTTQSACAAIVRSYQNYHMDTNGWNDIGYNFLVGEDGNVYEGRGWGIVGAHAPGHNFNSHGICVIGDFSSRVPNEKALQAVKDLIQCGIDLGKIQSSYVLEGHRQTSSTDCPGNALYNEIKTWSHWSAKMKDDKIILSR